MAAARQGTPQRGSGGWPPDIKPCLCVTMKSVLNAKPPLTASAYSASLRLCVKHLYTLYTFYTAITLHLTFTSSPSTRSTRSTRLKIFYLLFVYLVYFVVQISASFAFFLTTVASAKVVAATGI